MSTELIEAAGATGDALRRVRSRGLVAVDPVDTLLTASVEGQLARVEVDDVDAESKITEAITRAAERKASILLLPELSAPEGTIEKVLRSIDDEYPVVTIAGLHHHLLNGDGPLVNMAVMYSAEGRVLEVYRKRTRMSIGDVVECHLTGNHTTLIPSPLGLLAMAICRDVFDERVLSDLTGSFVSAIFAPSLSPKTTEHEYASNQIRRDTPLAAVFVCNRWGVRVEGRDREPMHPEDGLSFALVPGADLNESGEFVRGLTSLPRFDLEWPQHNSGSNSAGLIR